LEVNVRDMMYWVAVCIGLLYAEDTIYIQGKSQINFTFVCGFLVINHTKSYMDSWL